MFYDVYKELCTIHGEKPYKLPLKLGAKSNSMVAQWAKGSLPRPEMLQKIAEYFDVPVSYLMFGKTDEKNTANGNVGGWEAEAVELLKRLSPDELERELAYLRERVGERDK